MAFLGHASMYGKPYTACQAPLATILRCQWYDCPMKRFPEQIKQLRIDKRMSQAELGDIVGVSRAAVSEWESAKSVPRLDKLAELARFFDVSIAQLSGTPSAKLSIDAELARLPEDLQTVLRESFKTTIDTFAARKKS